MDIFSGIAGKVDDIVDLNSQVDAHMGFEPWDCEVPDDEMIRAAAEDGVDLFSGPQAVLSGPRPRPFQSGIITSTKKLAVVQGGSQIGKSFPVLKLMEIAISHKIPYSLRYPFGEDTGILRAITEANIKRFGRRDSVTGEFIDRNVNAIPDMKEWNCGAIMGRGAFPKQLLAPAGCQIWLGTMAQSVETYWWPRFCGGEGQRIFSPDMIDLTKGNGQGFNKTRNIVHAIRNIELHVKTYDSKLTAFESHRAFIIVLDEEPSHFQIFRSVYDHCDYLRLCFTPLKGITWSKEKIFGGGFDLDYFHASQYDSPYQDRKDIRAKRGGYAEWDRKITIWGEYAEQTGKPFYDRAKINTWTSRLKDVDQFAIPEPKREYYGVVSRPDITTVPGLIDVQVKPRWTGKNDDRLTWRVFEKPIAGVGYVITSDQAEGAETVEAVGDWSTAIVARQSDDDPKKPVICATFRSSLEVLQFARSVMFMARWYNNALLAPENGRGSANATFVAETRDWPWYYYFTTTQDSTNKKRKKKGFDTNSGTRDMIFRFVGDWISAYNVEENPDIPDPWILKEAAGAVVGKTAGGAARCDHTSDGTLDSLTAFAILLWVMEKDFNQISCNSLEEDIKREGLLQRYLAAEEPQKPKFLKIG